MKIKQLILKTSTSGVSTIPVQLIRVLRPDAECLKQSMQAEEEEEEESFALISLRVRVCLLVS